MLQTFVKYDCILLLIPEWQLIIVLPQLDLSLEKATCINILAAKSLRWDKFSVSTPLSSRPSIDSLLSTESGCLRPVFQWTGREEDHPDWRCGGQFLMTGDPPNPSLLAMAVLYLSLHLTGSCNNLRMRFDFAKIVEREYKYLSLSIVTLTSIPSTFRTNLTTL